MAFAIRVSPFLQTGIPGFLSAHAVQVHVTKHHQAYVDYCNRNIPGTAFEGRSLESVVSDATGPLFNNAAQHYNHAFFWDCLTADPVPIPAPVASFLTKHFKTVDAFKTQFTEKAAAIFGSGWAFLAVNQDLSVTIGQYTNALNPVKEGGYPILVVDAWEHAWYVDYENRKAEYFANFWNAVNWTFVASRIANAPLS
jgi:Fe-Mn family superoxide dismutase